MKAAMTTSSRRAAPRVTAGSQANSMIQLAAKATVVGGRSRLSSSMARSMARCRPQLGGPRSFWPRLLCPGALARSPMYRSSGATVALPGDPLRSDIEIEPDLGGPNSGTPQTRCGDERDVVPANPHMRPVTRR